MILLYLFETYLDVRQYAVLKKRPTPPISQVVISPEKLRKSRAYSIDKSRLHFVHEFAYILVDCMILLYNILPWLWEGSGSFLVCIGLNAENEFLHSFSFLAAMTMLSQKTIWQFSTELLLGQCITWVFGALIVAAAIVLEQYGGSHWVFYLWAYSSLGSIATTILYPQFIAPIFNKFILAYMFGVRKKILVLSDTLTKQCQDTDEIVAIIAHEMGHWKLNHTVHAFVAMQVPALLQFGLFSLVWQSNALFQIFGFDTQTVVIGFYIYQHIVMPVQRLLEFFMNLLSRSSEFMADAFAKDLGYGSALQANCNQSAVNTDPWYSAYHYSHPPLAERLSALDELMKKPN
uniref:CAAX prenyl protease n=1 Tax=Fagus sylvatica TaxID=28930 RepID=A0A2N9IQ23_FAGSY